MFLRHSLISRTYIYLFRPSPNGKSNDFPWAVCHY
jgi:hypothetical protein